MAQCPVCSGDIADDFGLIECTHCSAQLIVHVDGRVEHSGAPADEPPPLVGAQNESGDPEFNEEADFGSSYNEPPPQPEPEPEPEPEQEYQSESEDAYESEPSPEATSEPDPNFLDEPADEPPPVYSSQPLDSPDLSDVAEFGNSDQSGARDGALRYTLMISGIDTAAVRDSLREALTDRKLMWDTDQIIRSIRNGRLQIENVSAVKAYVLVSRLRNLPVQIKWEQYAIHQT